jgi:hypothetical protein
VYEVYEVYELWEVYEVYELYEVHVPYLLLLHPNSACRCHIHVSIIVNVGSEAGEFVPANSLESSECEGSEQGEGEGERAG